MKMFKKEDFKNGMVVQLDTGGRRLFWDGRFIDQLGFIPIQHFDENLHNMDRITYDENINAVYTVKNVGYFDDFFRDVNLTKVWSRY